MIINVADNNLADSLTAVGAIEYLAKSSGDFVYINVNDENERLLTVLPENLYGMSRIKDMLVGNHFQRIVTIRLSDIANSPFKKYHPTIAHYAYLGLPVPTMIPNPSVHLEESGLIATLNSPVDILIAPWSNNLQKMPKLDLIKNLIHTFSDKTIAILDSAQDIKIWQNVQYITSRPLYQVAGEMAKAKCVITIDNEYSRLAQLYSKKLYNHLLLCSDVEEEYWSSYPEAKTIYGNSNMWNLDHIIRQVNEIIGESLEETSTHISVNP